MYLHVHVFACTRLASPFLHLSVSTLHTEAVSQLNWILLVYLVSLPHVPTSPPASCWDYKWFMFTTLAWYLLGSEDLNSGPPVLYSLCPLPCPNTADFPFLMARAISWDMCSLYIVSLWYFTVWLILVYYILLFFEIRLTKKPWLDENLLHKPDWPQSCSNPLVSVFWVLRLQACSSMLC